ncbi:CobW family GTP-binding protein [Anaerocolumna xylanovorans]|uniref:GTPase, G3E family n=1 Tax=Anaerocolumna xylanovorans DSM 12503 TaxID=1121345 RepID=A0A1M7Y2X0_9FIRM|nr:GTP-binding protein [Anaerocolumna xylanovorans]SHO46109.1 GTPase, G3E family [Anaerocolumna xylanovorans DSM 12503]
MDIKTEKNVILITGYLGSGKTTLMNGLLKDASGRKVALVVNDMGAVNIDASLIRLENKNTVLDYSVVELKNGCICCTLRDEFMAQIERIADMEEIDTILVEASGISNPASIAEVFLLYEEENRELKAHLSTIVTVVDADRIYAEFLEELEDITEEKTEEDPDIINLIIEQVEFCNIILLNKCDLLSRKQLEEVKAVIRKFQPFAEIIETEYGRIDSEYIFREREFDYKAVERSSPLGHTLSVLHQDGAEKRGVHEEFGISSFVFEDRHPFDYDRFIAFLEKDYPEEIIRAKGYIWFSEDDMHVQLFEQAGRNSSLSEVSNWTAALPKEEQEIIFKQYPEVLLDWDMVYGDRMNQLVFIGKDYNREIFIQRLSDCLEKGGESTANGRN